MMQNVPDDTVSVPVHRLVHPAWRGSPEVHEVQRLADSLLEHSGQPDVRAALEQQVVVGSSSQVVQALVESALTDLGFTTEAKGLFADYAVPNLRPDYYRPLGGSTGIIFEVERGKTLINNMDLLDLWKCHLCRHAHHLWLMVPMQTLNLKGGVRERPFAAVVKRLSTFFTTRPLWTCDRPRSSATRLR